MPSATRKAAKPGPKKGVPRALPRRLDDEFSGRFKQAMAIKNFTEISLAKAAGCTKQVIFKYLNGESRTVEALLLLRLADVMDVSARWLLTGAGAVTRPQSIDTEQLRCLNVLARLTLEEARDSWISYGERLASIQPPLYPSPADPFRGLVTPKLAASSLHEPAEPPYAPELAGRK